MELVDVRNEIAKLNGYDNYAEYAYDAVYVRDYTLDETRDLLKEIRKHVVPVMADMKDMLYDTDYMRLYSEGQGIESTSIIEQIGPYLEEIDPELKDTQEHFLKYRLYDMDTSQNKANTAFTMRLSYFKDGFIYGQMYDNYMDYYNVIHEFDITTMSIAVPIPFLNPVTILMSVRFIPRACKCCFMTITMSCWERISEIFMHFMMCTAWRIMRFPQH